MCLYTPPCLYTPLYICMLPHTFIQPPVCLYAPQGCTHPQGPPMLLCSCMVLAHCMLWGGCFSVLCVLGHTTPIWGCLPPYYTPHSVVGSLCIVILRDISSYVGLSPSIEGFGSVPPITGGGWGDTSVAVHMLILLHLLFVVHYVSCLNHGSNYYSSNYSGIFWPVISVISISGSFSDRVSSKPWCGSTTTLDAEELLRCFWLHFYATAADSIFNASSGLCQLCYGFSTGRFFLFFRIEPPTVCILYMFGVCSGVCFLF